MMVDDFELKSVLRLVASNDEEIRQENFEKLQEILQQNDKGVDQIIFMKAWKSIFYHLWMCDKMINQERLANEISEMVSLFENTNQALLFIESFFLTVEREWSGLDSLRQDKFLMLIRKILYQAFLLLQKYKWDPDLSEKFLNILKKSMIDPPGTKSFDLLNEGLKFHVIDIYVQELCKAGSGVMPRNTSIILIQPFIETLSTVKSHETVERIGSHIFEYIIDQSQVKKELYPDSQDEERVDVHESSEETIEDPEISIPKNKNKRKKLKNRVGKTKPKEINPEKNIPSLEFDYKEISERMYNLASVKSCPAWNRKFVYDLVEKFDKLSQGEYPLIEEFEVIKPLKRSHVKFAATKLMKEERNLGYSKKKKRTKI